MSNTPSYVCGFELGSPHEAWFVSGTPTVSATNARTGMAMRCNPTNDAPQIELKPRAAAGGLRAVFQGLRFWLRVDALPSANTAIMLESGGTAIVRLTLNTTGTLTVTPNGGTTTATSTSALTADATYHRIELDAGWNAGAGVRVYVDGVEWASVSTGTVTTGTALDVGVITSATTDLYFDDIVAFSDDLGGVTWPDWKVVLLKPTADSNRGNWTGGAAGTTNLWDALNNAPPVGLTAGSDTDTSQIQNAVSATYPATAAQLGQFTCQSYLAGGIGSSDTIRAVQAVCNHGEGIATGTKPGGVFIVSNPAQGTLGDWFDYGDDAGACGTWPFTTAGTPTRGWFTAAATPVANPSVTLGTQPVVGVQKDVASTREGHVAFAGIYVVYSPVLPPELSGRPYGLHGQQQMHQLLSQ